MASTINASTSAGLVSTADTSGVLQLQTAGTTAVTVDGSQNVGIGTSSPSAMLTVRKDSTTAQPFVDIVNRSISSTFVQGGIRFAAYRDVADPSYVAAIWAVVDAPVGNVGNLAFGAMSNGGSSLPTERMRLDSSGNLGLGVTPSAWFTGAKYFQLTGDIGFTGTNNNSLRWNNYINSAGNADVYTETGRAAKFMYDLVNGTFSWSQAASGTLGNPITFTQAMTLDASGNLLVGTTSSNLTSGGLYFAPGSSSELGVGHASGSPDGSTFCSFRYANTQIGSITQSGTTAVLYNVTSDQRLKENIVDAPEFGSVIDSIKVRSYDWKTDNKHQRAGFVAQELVTVAPEAVHQPADSEEMMAVDYSKLVPMLVKEIQSLRIRIAQLEAK